ncbi:miles to go isoform X2 [Oratosquilla oratoria]|uniref:miles to go isoform X2 n=1 Tax=Oratosquilla oratoria TaxID=337810 RepID=UPI003F761F47
METRESTGGSPPTGECDSNGGEIEAAAAQATQKNTRQTAAAAANLPQEESAPKADAPPSMQASQQVIHHLKIRNANGEVLSFRIAGPSAGQPTPPPQFYGAPPPPQGYVATYQPPPPQFSPHMSPPLSQTSPPPPHNFHKPDRAKQHDKPRPKVQQRYQKPTCNSLHNTPPHSPKKELLVKKAGEEENSNVDEEDSQVEPTLLPQIKPPTISKILPRSATLHWSAPEWKEEGRENGVSDLRYEVFVNGNYNTTVTTTDITLDKLSPATEYQVHLVCVTDAVRGTPTESQTFTTLSTVPDTPAPPRCAHKSRSYILLRWAAAKENGSKITAYCLELCSVGSEWREVFRGKGKQYTVNKLQPQTTYRVRLFAINEHGKSEYSEETEVCTSGSPPSQPQPVGLEKPGINSLILTWTRRQQDESFTLQMEDALNGYGFRPVYDGRETRYVCRDLRRNTDYKFRLCTHNEAGTSPFSDIACYRTLPDRPKPPSIPVLKGRPHSTRLVITWNPPVDHGGSPVSVYRAEMDHGEGFVCVYTGELCECECQNLKPGTSYHVRVNGSSSGGASDWSSVATLCTEAVCPTQCQAPKLVGKPKASTLQLRWGSPEYDGGAQVTQFEIDMTSPDNERRQVYCGRDTECTVASLLPGRPYIFLVRAVNRIGAGAWSEPLEVVSGAGPPDAPHTPQLTCRAPHTVHVAWEEPINNGAGIEQYTVQVAEVSCPHAESSESSSTCGDMESDLAFSTAHTGHSTTAEVRNLNPATTYAFRIQASNSAGSGPWSAHSMVTTPAAPPAPVAYLSASPAATSVTLLWGEPANHGDPITHYVIEVADKTFTTPGLETEYTVTDLLPETQYKVRIQAVNSVGPGGFSAVTKVITRALPPSPPQLELVKASHNSLRLKWGDGRNADMITYYLQMEFPKPHSNTTEFYNIYNGTNQNYKVGKLEENTTYRLRIFASNEAGDGPFSTIVEMTTTKAPPNPVKPPRAIECPGMTYRIEWSAVKCRGDDPIMYRLQVLQAGKDKDYSVVYTGSETSYTLTELEPSTWYNVRVCGVRVCEDGETMAGAFSTPAVFNTPKPVPATYMTTPVHTTKESSFHWRDLSDQHKALTILFGFSLVAIIIALGVQHFLSPQATTR